MKLGSGDGAYLTELYIAGVLPFKKMSEATKIQLLAVICMKQTYWEWKKRHKPIVVL